MAVVLAEARARQLRAQRLLVIYGRDPMTPIDVDQAEDGGLLGIDESIADLDLEATARFEIRTDRLKNERCTAFEALDPNSGCRAKFKAPRLENEFNVLAGGVLGRRVNINVDWDTQRELDASNTIQVFYQGLDDEIVRRIEVGTVQFRPPPSRLITAQIPSNNFGVNAAFEVGPWQLQALAATQEGSVVAERRFTIGATTSEPQERLLRDKDFESGRFFWVVDPTLVPGYPAVDILEPPLSQIPQSVLPADVRVYRFRPRAGETGADPNLGGINAFGVRGGSEPGLGARWELLLQNTDYYLDPSGLWLALNTKLASDEYLAVSYLASDGSRVGTFPGADRGLGPNQQYLDTLQVVAAPQTQLGQSVFLREMRQVYRIAGTDLDKNSLEVAVTLNRSSRPLSGGAETYLALLGLALPSDQSSLDIDNRVFPRLRDSEAASVVRESYIVFPHTAPFADATKLTTAAERQDSLYRTPTYLVLGSQGPPSKYELNLQYEAAGGADRSQINLNAIQISPGTERLALNGRPLEQGLDYEIDYAIGLVTFLDPDILFGTGAAQLTATFEERGFFVIAPTSIFGLTTTYSLGRTGSVSLLGLYQQEQSAFTRPPLGFEPTANFVGGITTDLRFESRGLTNFLNGLTSAPASAPSTLDLNAEVALSRPVANRIGQAYLDEFEADAGIRISMSETNWEFGSIPSRTDGITTPGFGAVFDTADVVQMTWQNFVLKGGQVKEVRPQDIDSTIVIAGQQGEFQEAVLYLTFHADTAGGVVQTNNSSRWTRPQRVGPRFRSMVTSLSNTGLDLTNNEFLEFWVFDDGRFAGLGDAGAQLVIDMGTVSEDAIAIAPDTLTIAAGDSVFSGLQYVGRGRLDTERSVTGIFNADTDDLGILGDRPDSIFVAGQGWVAFLPLCQRVLSNVLEVFPWGDLDARCTNANGRLDSEDLNGDDLIDFNALNVSDNVFRWVIDATNAGQYFVKQGNVEADGSRWLLFRVPLNEPQETIGIPNRRLISHLRMTVTAPTTDADTVVRWGITRMKLTGAPWIRRAQAPIDGISGQVANATGQVVVTTVSTTEGQNLGYVSPPGVIDQGQNSDVSQDLGAEINETSLRVYAVDQVLGEALQVNSRAEAVRRFSAGPQNALSYRELRLWMRGRGAGWNEGDLEGFVKIASDDRNFYFYRTPLKAGVGAAPWEPEVVVNLDIWRDLRGQVESAWLQGQPPSGAAQCGLGDSTAYVACNGPYLVHVADPGINPPNLAAFQEIAAGILRVNQSVVIDTAEMWVDDVRLTGPVNDVGTAFSIDGRLVASDVGSVTFGLTRRSGQFRQLGDSPSFQSTSNFQLGSSLRLDRFLPASWGIFAPATISYSRSATDPQLVRGTDIVADRLESLRKPESWSTTMTLSLRRSVRGRSWLSQGLLDPLSFSGSLTRGQAQTDLSSTQNVNWAGALTYNLALTSNGFSLGLDKLVSGLPEWFGGSEAGQGLSDARLNLVPRNVRLGSRLARDRSDVTTFLVAVERPSDANLRPIKAESHLWVNNAGLTWQPLGMLTLSGDLTSTRDLRRYADTSSIGRLTNLSRKSFMGVDVGVEKTRSLSTQLSLTPRINSWLRPRYVTGSSFGLNRDLISRPPVRAEGDTAGAFLLPQTYTNSRSRELGASLETARLVRSIFGDSSGVTTALARLRPLDASTRTVRSSTFDLATFEPSMSYQLGLGNLAEFQSQEGELARGVSEVITNQVSTGATLPYGIQANVSYGLVRTFRFTRSGTGFLESRIRSKEWPVGNLRWSMPLNRGLFALIGLGLTYRRVEGTTVVPSTGGDNSTKVNITKNLSPDLNLTLRNGLNFTLNYSSSDALSSSNGNTTETAQRTLNGTINYSFPLPRSLSPRRRPVRSSLFALATNQSSCLQRTGELECLTISDISRQEVRLAFDTDVSQLLQGGIQVSYALNDVKHLDRKTSQIIISLNFTLSLFAGDFR